MKKKLKLSMMQMLLGIGTLPLVVAMVITITLAATTLRKNLVEQTQLRLIVACEDANNYFSVDWDEWIAKGEPAQSDYDYVDTHIDDDMYITIFKGDTRFISSITDAEGKRIAGTKANDDVIQQVLVDGNSYFSTSTQINGENYYVYYLPLYRGEEIVGMSFAGVKSADVDKTISSTIGVLIGTAVVVTLLCVIAIIFIAIVVKRPLLTITKSMKVLADGQIHQGIDSKSFLKETTETIESAKFLQGNLQTIVQDVKTTSSSLTEQVIQVDKLSEASSDSALQINNAVEELAHTAMSMAENVQSVNAQVMQMGDSVADISMNVERLSASSDSIRQVSDEAMLYMGNVMDSSQKSVEAINAINTQVLDTNESVGKINTAIELILGIADQTKLLSLNASIEAARAGDAGKGFAVVAESIKQLSEQSSDGANAIKELADEIIAKSEDSVRLTDTIKETIAVEQEQIAETQNKFNVLNTEIEKSLAEIQSIDAKTEDLRGIKDSIIGNVQDLSAISEENAASNQEVTASVENIAHAISEISDKSGMMSSMAEKFEEAVNFFK